MTDESFFESCQNIIILRLCSVILFLFFRFTAKIFFFCLIINLNTVKMSEESVQELNTLETEPEIISEEVNYSENLDLLENPEDYDESMMDQENSENNVAKG